MRIRDAIVLALSITLPARALAGPLDTLQPGEWYEVPSSHMRAIDPCPQRTCNYSAVEGQAAVINDWSGGAFDTQRDQLIIFGGGHGGYAGNEIYLFDLATLSWRMAIPPSDPVTANTQYAPDGAPTSRHTYNYIQYVPPPIDRFVSFGGAGFYQDGQHGTLHVDAFDLGAARWETQRFADTQANNLIGSITAYDPMTGHVFQHGGDQSWLIELDPTLNQWTSHGDQFSGSYVDYYKTAAIDPGRRKMLAVGRTEVWAWDLSRTGDIPGTMLTTQGGTDFLSASSPGFVFDPEIDRFVGWKGGASVYLFDLDTLTWTEQPPAPTNAVTPTAPNGNGTFGRFRFSPTHNVFVLVNDVDQDVFVYKLSAGGGMPPPPFDAGFPDARPSDAAGAADAMGGADAMGRADAIGAPDAIGAADAGAISDDSGAISDDSGAISDDSGTITDAGAASDGAIGTTPSGTHLGASGGCGCRTTAPDAPASTLPIMLLAATLAITRRRQMNPNAHS